MLIPTTINPVIYNPKFITGEHAKMLLHDSVKEHIHYDLSSDQLNELMQYDSNHLNEFVVLLREMINE
jgi:hypothetical protein